MLKINELPRCAPEKVGIPSAAIMQFIQDAEQSIHELHSVMIIRHGCVAAEGWWAPYAPGRPHMLFSLSKSFTSTGIGLAAAEGRLAVDDPLISFFPEDAPAEVSTHLAAMKVRHLLSMATGHAVDTLDRVAQAEDGNFIKAFLALPVEHDPGSFFCYNNGATYMLSAIVQKVTGMRLVDYLTARLFEPLGIEDASWDLSPQGINMGFSGLHIKTEDIARLGLLYLNKGAWQGQQILPETWVTAATSVQVSNSSEPSPDWSQGYGYQFWRCRHNAFRGDGAFGQFCIVLPEFDAVVAITSGVADMQAVLDLFWKDILPAFQPRELPANPEERGNLEHKLANLTFLPPPGLDSSPEAAGVTGRLYNLLPNPLEIDQVRFDFTLSESTLTLRDKTGEHQVQCGNGAWLEGETTLLEHRPMKVAASGVWKTPLTYQVIVRFYETPFYHTLESTFDSDKVTIENGANVSFGPTKLPTLTGNRS